MAAGRADFHFIVNPQSGAKRVRQTLVLAVRQLQHRGSTTQIHETERPGHATEIAAQLGDCRGAISVGGDGTLREVASGLIGSRVPLAVLPSGTENLVARQLGFRRDAGHLCKTLLDGKTQQHDAAFCNGRLFLVVAGIGFDAEVVHRLAAERRGHITYVNYAVPLWRTFWEHRYPRLCVEVDGRPVFDAPGFMLVANVPRYALGLSLFHQGSSHDQLLDVRIFPAKNQLQLMAHAYNALVRPRGLHHGALYLQGAEVVVSSSCHAPVELDGDPGGLAPVRLFVGEQPLNFFVPSDGAAHKLH